MRIDLARRRYLPCSMPPERFRRLHMDIRITLGCTVLVLSLALAGCDEKLSDITGPTPNLEPTLSSIQREIFDTTDASGRLACTNCHTNAGGRNPSGGLNLVAGVAHSSLVGVGSI